MNSVVEVKIKCGVCNKAGIKNITFKPSTGSQEILWTCPECGTRKTVIVRKREPELDKERPNDEPSKYRIDNLGRKIRLDDQGNVELKQPILPLGKKRKREPLHGDDVEEI